MSLPDLNSDDFGHLVDDALHHLWENSYLGEHSLVGLQIVKQRVPSKKRTSHLDLGRALADVLQEAIKSAETDPKRRGPNNEWRHHPILTQAFLEGVEIETIASQLHVSSRTIYRDLPKAIQVVAKVLRDWEQAARALLASSDDSRTS